MAANPSSALKRSPALKRSSAQNVATKPVSEAPAPAAPEPIREVLPPEELAAPAVAPEVIATEAGYESHHEAISRAAYFLAEARGFDPGHDLDDWLAAEQQLGLR